MILKEVDLEKIDNHWVIEAYGIKKANKMRLFADEYFVTFSLRNLIKLNRIRRKIDFGEVEKLANGYEIAALEGIHFLIHPTVTEEDTILQKQAQAGAYRAFGLRRIIDLSPTDDEKIFEVLHLASLGYCSDRWTDLNRWIDLNNDKLKITINEDINWEKRLLSNLYKIWIRILRKKDWDDISKIIEIVASLRKNQRKFEGAYLKESRNNNVYRAYKLIAIYHWATATEKLAEYIIQGSPISIDQVLDKHYEPAIKATLKTNDIQFHMLLKWLHATSKKMVSNSLWEVAHRINSFISGFVENATRNQGLFELLPPQKEAILESGLLDQSNRAIIVNIPTSGGKTILAQFRILQALNNFKQENCWIAYVAPTRALVTQITRKFKIDFSPLGIRVEQLSGAVEIDGFEENLLEATESFDVLVSTPEKLQMVIRNKKVKRSLVLIVMDEAHNLEDENRGLRFELLLATIKQDYPKANFLLLMPFVDNAHELSQWLAPNAGKTISLSTVAWRPNERIIGMFYPERLIGKNYKRGDWRLKYESLITSQKSIKLHGIYNVGDNRPINNLSFSKAKSLSMQAAAMGLILSKRGASIVISNNIPNVWNTARNLMKDIPEPKKIHSDVKLVQNYLKNEISQDFELIDMLGKQIAVHHAGLPSEVRILIEWLTENNHIKILCATTTIAQGINFPVSSIFISTINYAYEDKMTHREFWNLVGRAGRMNQDSIGVVGIAAGTMERKTEIMKFVSSSIGSLVSRIVKMLDELEKLGRLNDLSTFFHEEQWTDFRSYIAHLWNEKKNLDHTIHEVEVLLRNTYGFSSLRNNPDKSSQEKADTILKMTKTYVLTLANHPENASLADSTGFSPEGVRDAILALNQLENRLISSDWTAENLFGSSTKILTQLYGIMLNIPQLKDGFESLRGTGGGGSQIANITYEWVSGKSIKHIALKYFSGKNDTIKISNACRAIYRDLGNNGAWGISALTKMPTSGIDFDKISTDQKRQINNLPAMIYHGVNTEAAVLMRMNSIPRSISGKMGSEFKKQYKSSGDLNISLANIFLESLSSKGWEKVIPEPSNLSGNEYKIIWHLLSGNSETIQHKN